MASETSVAKATAEEASIPNTSPIYTASARADRAIEELTVLVTRLEERLDRALAPATPRPERDDESGTSASIVGQWFTGNARSIEALSERLRVLLDRIEL